MSVENLMNSFSASRFSEASYLPRGPNNIVFPSLIEGTPRLSLMILKDFWNATSYGMMMSVGMTAELFFLETLEVKDSFKHTGT